MHASYFQKYTGFNGRTVSNKRALSFIRTQSVNTEEGGYPTTIKIGDLQNGASEGMHGERNKNDCINNLI